MEADTYVTLASQALWLILQLSIVPLLASLTVGLFISFLQALTQVQEQTLTFVPKIIVTILAIILTAHMMLILLQDYAQRVFNMIPHVG